MANVRGNRLGEREGTRSACVDEAGRGCGERVVAHDEAGIARSVAELVALEVGRVAIERPDGILVDRLLEAGLTVIAIHPNQAKAARERYTVAHGKSDRFDAFVLAELARTDGHRFRAIRPTPTRPGRSGRSRARARTSSRRGSALANQLRAQLEAFWPGALVFADVDCPISLAFLGRYPSPADARGLGPGACWLARPPRLLRTPDAPRSCSRGCAPPRRAAPASSRPTPAGPPCSAWSRALSRSSPRSASSPPRSAARVAPIPTADLRAAVSRPEDRVCPATLIAELGDPRERYPTDAACSPTPG